MLRSLSTPSSKKLSLTLNLNEAAHFHVMWEYYWDTFSTKGLCLLKEALYCKVIAFIKI